MYLCRPIRFSAIVSQLKNNLYAVEKLLQVKTIHFRNLVALDFVTCYIFDVNIFFDNHDNHGKIPITLKIKDHWLGNCSGTPPVLGIQGTNGPTRPVCYVRRVQH